MICPKCGYARAAADTNPAWQCPKCQIAYAKFKASAPMVSRIAAGGRELAVEAKGDLSVYVLIAANLLALAIAWVTHMSLRELMLVYWIQSVIIGISSAIRILSLERFSTENLRMNNQPIEEVPASKWKVAGFFVFHYGFFHFIYLMFLPYARIVPMHFTIILGGLFFGGTWAFAMFGGLKIAADVAMHTIEHYVLAKRGS